MTADEIRKIAADARHANITPLEQAALDAALQTILVYAKQGRTQVEINVPKECDNAIRLRLRALGYKAEWGQMTANITYIKVNWE